MALHRIQSDHVAVAVDLRVGHLRGFEAHHSGRVLAPLFTAPWADDPQAHGLPVERHLSGDFFCAPFAASNVEQAPQHGWSANSAWFVDECVSPSEAILTLDQKIMGATLTKHLRCAVDAPLLYQTHHFNGGTGALPVAHHVITHMQEGGVVCHSPKQLAITPDTATDPGLNHLICPAKSADLRYFPSRDGTANLTEYPLANCHEDFVSLVEEGCTHLGWTAVLRKAENDILFVLKDPAVLPVTMHWYAHGARQVQPWRGQTGILGIEDGCSGVHSGHRASLEPSTLTRLGVPTAIDLSQPGGATIRHVIGTIACPIGWDRVTNIKIKADTLSLQGPGDETISMSFEPTFFSERTNP